MMKSNHSAFLPSLITLMNLMCGFIAIFFASQAQDIVVRSLNLSVLSLAGYMIFIAMIPDMLDGYVARLTGAVSPLGAELDNLADVVSFGAAPAFLVLKALEEPIVALSKVNLHGAAALHLLVFAISLMYLFGAALRLARFSTENSAPETLPEGEKATHKDFTGLPSPVAAGIVAGVVVLREYVLRKIAPFVPEFAVLCGRYINIALPVLTLAASFLMVSRIPYIYLLGRLKVCSKNAPYIVFMFINLLLAWFSLPIALCAAFLGYTLLAIKPAHKNACPEIKVVKF